MAIITMGIDVGSTASKCIVLKDGKEIIGKALTDVGAGTSGPERVVRSIVETTGMQLEEMDYILATGYGRNSFEQAQSQMSELSCHARGAYFLFPEVHTVIDIGGQDVKVLQIENGAMINFQMNDKCAAGTGRFLDVMARVLEVKVSAPTLPRRSASVRPAPSLRKARSSASLHRAPTSAILSTASIIRFPTGSRGLPTGSGCGIR